MHRPSALRLRSVLTLTLALPLPLSACDGGDKSDAKADAKAEDNKADAKAEEKKAEEPKKEEPKEKKLENTWDADSVKEALRGGVVLNYKQTGTDAKGKAVEVVVRKLGVSEQTFYRWRKRYGGSEGGPGEAAQGAGA